MQTYQEASQDSLATFRVVDEGQDVGQDVVLHHLGDLCLHFYSSTTHIVRSEDHWLIAHMVYT